MLGHEGYKDYLTYSVSKLARTIMKSMKADRNPATVELYERNIALLVHTLLSH